MPHLHTPLSPYECVSFASIALHRAQICQWCSSSFFQIPLSKSCPRALTFSCSVLPQTLHTRMRSPSYVHVAGVASSHSSHVCSIAHIAYNVKFAYTGSDEISHMFSPAASVENPTRREHCFSGRSTFPSVSPSLSVTAGIILPPCESNVTVKYFDSFSSELFGSSPPGRLPPGVCCPVLPPSLQAAKRQTASTRHASKAMMTVTLFFIRFLPLCVYPSAAAIAQARAKRKRGRVERRCRRGNHPFSSIVKTEPCIKCVFWRLFEKNFVKHS